MGRPDRGDPHRAAPPEAALRKRPGVLSLGGDPHGPDPPPGGKLKKMQSCIGWEVGDYLVKRRWELNAEVTAKRSGPEPEEPGW